MTGRRLAAIAALSCLGWTGSARAERDLVWFGEGKAIRGSLVALGRAEAWDWFDAGAKYAHAYRSTFETIRPGLSLRWTRWGLVSEGQVTAFQNLPERAVAPAPKGALGPGATYFQHVGRSDRATLFLKTLYAENTDLLGPWVNTLRVRAGRMPFSDGVEVAAGEPKLDWLKRMRVAERLLGPVGWAAYQRSYDGVDAGLLQGWGGVTAFAARPTQGAFEEEGGKRIDGIDVVEGAVTLIPGLGVPHTAARAFYLGYRDARAVTQRVDNVKAVAPAVDIDVRTAGGDVEGAYPLGDGELDVLAWGAWQSGGWYELDHKASAWVGEAGYQWTGAWGKPHLRGGGSAGSGDHDPKDGVHGTFYQVLPTARKYALTPFTNMMNNRDLYVQALVKPTYPLTVRADLHWLALDDPNDRWYVGAGATRATGAIFGFAGRNASGLAGLGKLADVSVTYAPDPRATFTAYAGRIFGGTVEKAIYKDDSASYAYAEMEFKL